MLTAVEFERKVVWNIVI